MKCTPTLFLILSLAILTAHPSVPLAGMIQGYQATGTLGLEVVGLAGQNLPTVLGSLMLNQIPGSAVVQKAYLYVSQINSVTGYDANLNNQLVPNVGPYASDAAFNTLYTFRHDVTSLVLPGLNQVAIGQTQMGSPIAGVALAVVWSDPNEPQRTVTIVDGMQQVGESGAETEFAQFTGQPAGATKAWVFTVYDDSASSGESITYNGPIIGGPLDGNLGFNASVLSINTTSNSGTNSMGVTTFSDHMGWMVAATAVDLPPVGAEARSWGKVKALFR